MTQSISLDAGALVTLIELLSRQHELYVRLHELTENQTLMLQQHKAEALLEVLSRRQGVVDQVVAVSAELAPYREAWDKLIALADKEQHATIQRLVHGVGEMHRVILDQDEKDKQQLTQVYEAQFEQRQQMTSNNLAARAYQAAGAQQSVSFTNRQG